MTFIRYVLPAVILLAGVVLVIVRGGDLTSWEGASALWGAGLSVLLINFLYRMGVSGDRSREQEERDRAFLDEHGHWPDEQPPVRRRPGSRNR